MIWAMHMKFGHVSEWYWSFELYIYIYTFIHASSLSKWFRMTMIHFNYLGHAHEIRSRMILELWFWEKQDSLIINGPHGLFWFLGFKDVLKIKDEKCLLQLQLMNILLHMIAKYKIEIGTVNFMFNFDFKLLDDISV